MTMPLPLIAAGKTSWLLAQAFSRLASVSSEASPCLLLVMPPSWNNRYQTLLYGQALPMGYVVMGVNDPALLDQISWPGPIVLHAHWFAGLFNGCESEVAAHARLAQLQAQVEAFRARTRSRLLWTAHNVFPHGNRFPATFLKLRQWVFDTFDAIHVHHIDHILLLEANFGRSSPASFVVPHMLYTGSHPDTVTTEAARSRYEIPLDAFVFGYFGSIHDYKRLDRFLAAFDRIAELAGRSTVAMIGGMPSDPAEAQRLMKGWGQNPRVRLELRTIPDYEIQYIHRASDVMVFAYGETLNSGAAFMAASFEKPFIMPQGPASVALEGLGLIDFDPEVPNGLEQAMREVMNGLRGNIDPVARACVAPNIISAAFFSALDGVIGRQSAPGRVDKRDSLGGQNVGMLDTNTSGLEDHQNGHPGVAAG